MFLRAIATYDYEDDDVPKLVERKSAYEKWGKKGLSVFVKKHLQDFIEAKQHIVLPVGKCFKYEVNVGDCYYFKRVHDGRSDRLLLMQSRASLGDLEMAYLFVNINHIDVGHKAIHDTLDDVLHNTLQYTGKDLLVKSVHGQAQDLKGVMLDNIDKVLQRGEELEELVSRSAALERSSQVFLENSTQLKENQQCCGGLRTTTRHAGEAVTGLFAKRSETATTEEESELLAPVPKHN